ncbi:MAG TPA: thioredoxin family protein, partial [Flavobacteriales bacterium]|nr:thioredoxin family protein [Flavobacteriales bacterium]
MKRSLLSIALITGVCAFTNAQTFVSQTPENKNVVLEEFTGIYCTFCPDGHKRAQQLADDNPNDVVLVNIHVGGYADPGTSGDP